MATTNIRQAVMLAGGMGVRLRPYTNTKPKLMVEVGGRPFAEYLIDELKKNGITELVFLLGYLPEQTQDYFGDGSRFGIKFRYSVTPIEDSTGTRIYKAKELLDERFLLLYCDNFLHFNINQLLSFHLEKNALMTMIVYRNHYGVTKNNLFLNKEGYVERYDRERKADGLNGVDLGFFIVEKKVVDLMPKEDFWLFDFFPSFIPQKKLAGLATDNLYYSLSTPERMKQTERFFAPRKVIFLDRDGVINKRQPKGDWVKKWSEFQFLPGVFEAIKLLKNNHYEIYIISNQSGIARGALTAETYDEIKRNMISEIKKNGGHVDGFYHCPHDWDSPCLCRKPKPGMLFQAAIDHQIDLPSAVFIGDDERDGQAGEAAGVPTILIESDGSLLDAVKKLVTK